MSLKTTNLLHLKLYLNKYAKYDNIDNYTLSSLREMESEYREYLKNNKGYDVSFPGLKFKIDR